VATAAAKKTNPWRVPFIAKNGGDDWGVAALLIDATMSWKKGNAQIET
jgi:hypothetical protein